MYNDENDEELSEEDIKRLQEMQKYQTEQSHGSGMDADVTRESTNEVSPTVNNGGGGLDMQFHKDLDRDREDLGFPSVEETENAQMSEEEQLQNKIAELEDEAMQRKNRISQKQRLRELKRNVRKAKVREAVAPASERLEPLVSGGKKAADVLGRAGKKGADVLSAMGRKGRDSSGESGGGVSFGGDEIDKSDMSSGEPGGSGMSRLGSGLDMGSKSNLGTTGRKQAGVSLSENKKEDMFGRKKESGISGVLQNENTGIGFSGKKKSMFDMGGKRERLVDWGSKKDSGIGFGSKKDSGLSFDAKPGSKFSFGNEKRPRKKKSKSSEKDSLDINLIIGRK